MLAAIEFWINIETDLKWNKWVDLAILSVRLFLQYF